MDAFSPPCNLMNFSKITADFRSFTIRMGIKVYFKIDKEELRYLSQVIFGFRIFH
ncbi:hypothetical protein ADICYQ_0167 [Cyclobacterium qasimii M12-11B]|uniref:Uncharacterized protein n=1 Tax=Cyclobacterium qasimii M12-11B TaxID=641524 RepID=S7VP35_9BACT|nr:hypothetical protein ADICYQ_0167 [Cyclobacterium qasimii M12-11B]